MKQTKYSLNLTHPHYEHKKRKRKQNKKLYLYTLFQWQVTNVIGIKVNCGVLHISKNIKRSHLQTHPNISFDNYQQLLATAILIVSLLIFTTHSWLPKPVIHTYIHINFSHIHPTLMLILSHSFLNTNKHTHTHVPISANLRGRC